MKKIAFSLLSIVILIAMALPVASVAVLAQSGCAINIQIDPSNGAAIYIFNEDTSTFAVNGNGTILTPNAVDVDCNHNYTVWVEKDDHTYRVKNAHGWNVTPEGDKAYGYLESGKQNLHFHGDPENIVENKPPVADANGPYQACVGEPITFNGSASYDPDINDTLEYRWDFQSNGTWDTNWSNSAYANNTWYTPFAGNVTLEVRDLYEGVVLGGNDTDMAAVVVNPAPIANFSAEPASGCAPLPVNFTDLSTGNPTNWTWDFGEGTNSTQQNPSHQY